MSLPEPFVGDVGTDFIGTIKDSTTDTAVDISGVSVKQIIFKKADGTAAVRKDAEFVTNGEDGQIHYIAEDGLFSGSGNWKWEAYVEWAVDSKYSTSIEPFRVGEVLE